MSAAPTNTPPALYTKKIGPHDGQPVVVYLHGLFGQGKNFNTAARQLLPDFNGLLVDLPNHGHSPHTNSFDYLHMADAVAHTLRTELQATPVHVVGHSMGGKVAMLLALRHPELVDHLVVEDISPVSMSSMSEFNDLLGTLRDMDLNAITDRTDADAAIADAITNHAVRQFLLQNLRRTETGWHWLANLDLLHNSLTQIGAFPTPETTFDGPTLWMGGENSPYIQPEHDAAMTALFPRTINLTVKNAGHWIHSEQPKAFVEALKVFFR